jgi:hypothetical protein
MPFLIFELSMLLFAAAAPKPETMSNTMHTSSAMMSVCAKPLSLTGETKTSKYVGI